MAKLKTNPTSGTPKWPGFALLAVFVLGLTVLLWSNRGKTAGRQTILFVTADSKAEAILRGTDLFYQQYPDLARQVDVQVRTKSNADEGLPLPASDMLLFYVHESDMLDQFKTYLTEINTRFGSQPGVPAVKFALGKPNRNYEEKDIDAMGLKRDILTEQYMETGSPQDISHLLAYLLNRYAGYNQLPIDKPVALPKLGYVVMKNGQVAGFDSTFADWQRHQQPDPKKPLVAYMTNTSYAHQQLLNIERAVLKELERRGAQPMLVYGYPGSKMVKKLLIDEAGKSRVKAVISAVFKFSDIEATPLLAQMDVPVLNAIDIYGPTISEWRSSMQGLSSMEVAWQLATPELVGLAPHTVIGGTKLSGQMTVKDPIPAGVERIVARAMRLLHLQKTPASGRKVAMLYWNYPPGKDNIGASYLNVLRSIPTMLADLQRRGYTVRGFDPKQPTALEETIKRRGRNVGRYAPGELAKMVAEGGLETIPVSTYKKWFAELNPGYQRQVTDHWDAPEKSDIMTIQKNGELHFVLPMIRLGNVLVMPQPDRAKTQDMAAMYHSNTLPPHHQYVAAYLWLQRNVDVLIHTGTHGTHEWLEGKETGLSVRDSPEVLAGDLPILYPYNMDVVGEGIVAKRRGAATIIDHLTPALGEAGLSPELQKLMGFVKQWEKTQSLNPEGTGAVLDQIEASVRKMGIAKDLEKNGWSAKTLLKTSPAERQKQMVEKLQHYIEDIREHSTPFGLHTFGVSPTGKRLDDFADIMLKSNPKGQRSGFRNALMQCGPEELKQLAHGLEGGYILPATGNDPIRNPTALPTGRNFFSFDPRTIPDAYADSTARRLAEAFVGNFKKENKKYPDKIALEVWGTETIRHQGIQEAQGLALMGLRLVRDKLGRVETVELIPRNELGRPRVDVLYSITGLYRDNFPMLVDLLDKGVRLAAASPEADNAIRQHADSLYAKLTKAGMDTATARRRSLVRCFAEPPGTYGNKVADASYASGSWDNEKQVADLYIERSGYGYGQGFHGEKMTDEFKSALSGTDAIIHSRTTSLYMSLDNDDFAAYAGAIAMGVRRVDGGKSPPLMVADLRRKGQEQYVSIERFMGQELRSRYFNPEYIKGMQQEGYAGAKELRESVDNLWGWAVAYPEVVNAEKWQEFYEVFLTDRYDLKMAEFFDKNSPHAKESMAARMMEAVRKGYWKPTDAVKKDLAKQYVESVAKHGVSCGHTTCDHPELQQYIKGVAATNSNIKASDVTKWVKQVETATGKTMSEALAQRKIEKARWKDPSRFDKLDKNDKAVAKNESAPAQKVKGYKMVEEKVVTAQNSPSKPAPVPGLYYILFGTQALCLLVGGLKRWI
jgi:cobaltochelatase CobN